MCFLPIWNHIVANEIFKEISAAYFSITHLRFDDFQVSHLNATSREVRNLKFDADGSLSFTTSYSSHTPAETSHHASTFLIVASYGG